MVWVWVEQRGACGRGGVACGDNGEAEKMSVGDGRRGASSRENFVRARQHYVNGCPDANLELLSSKPRESGRHTPEPRPVGT